MQALDLSQHEWATRGGFYSHREMCTSFSLSKPDPSLKSKTTLQSLSLRERTGVLSPVISLNIGTGVRNSGGRGPERALYSFIQNAPNQTQRLKSAARKSNVFLGHYMLPHYLTHLQLRWRTALPPRARAHITLRWRDEERRRRRLWRCERVRFELDAV
jgi:hypothetical protein